MAQQSAEKAQAYSNEQLELRSRELKDEVLTFGQTYRLYFFLFFLGTPEDLLYSCFQVFRSFTFCGKALDNNVHFSLVPEFQSLFFLHAHVNLQ